MKPSLLKKYKSSRGGGRLSQLLPGQAGGRTWPEAEVVVSEEIAPLPAWSQADFVSKKKKKKKKKKKI